MLHFTTHSVVYSPTLALWHKLVETEHQHANKFVLRIHVQSMEQINYTFELTMFNTLALQKYWRH